MQTPKKVSLTIDGKKIETEKGKTVLEAALESGIYIPHLCYHPDLSPFGACRLCVVEIDGLPNLPTACTTLVEEGMVVHTNTPKTNMVRRIAMDLILANHPLDCLTRAKNLKGEIQYLAAYLGITQQRFRRVSKQEPIDLRNPLFVIDHNKCILCGRCVRWCSEVRGVGAISFVNRGDEARVGTAFNRPLAESACRFCGGCVEVCPSGALTDKDGMWITWAEREASLVPCASACPIGLDIPRYLYFIAEGRFADALAVIREKTPFPKTLGRVCTFPCEDACRRTEINEPISIMRLKRFVADSDDGSWKKKLGKDPPTGKKVAIVGSGPAGLTAAYYLARLGHSCTVFETYSEPGGMMRMGIPNYRLPKEILTEEIEEIKRVGVEIKLKTKVQSLDVLFNQGYNAIFISAGAHQCVKIGIEIEDSPNVIDCISFLRNVNLGKKVDIGEKVAVIGGGNAAVDAARTARRLGAKDVTIFYRRTKVEMPAHPKEIEEAIQEGVKIKFLTAPTKIKTGGGRLKVEFVRMKLGAPDATGRKRPIPITGSEFCLKFETIIIAIGQRPEIPAQFQLKVGRGNKVLVDDENLSTSRKGVFAGGDAVTGAATVVEAIAAGRKAASAIDKYLGGKGIIEEHLAPIEGLYPYDCEYDETFASKPRLQPSMLPIEKRVKSFDEVELGLTQHAAVEEAQRCLRCFLRLQISKVERPPYEIGKPNKLVNRGLSTP